VFHDIQAGRILEQPARKDFRELVFGAALPDEQLHECARFLRHFPGSRALARLKADYDVADTLFFAGTHFEILADIVAFVEEAERRDPFRHGCADIRFVGRLHRRFRLLHAFRDRRPDGIFGFGSFLPAGRKSRRRSDEGECPAHGHASGDQAS